MYLSLQKPAPTLENALIRGDRMSQQTEQTPTNPEEQLPVDTAPRPKSRLGLQLPLFQMLTGPGFRFRLAQMK